MNKFYAYVTSASDWGPAGTEVLHLKATDADGAKREVNAFVVRLLTRGDDAEEIEIKSVGIFESVGNVPFSLEDAHEEAKRIMDERARVRHQLKKTRIEEMERKQLADLKAKYE